MDKEEEIPAEKEEKSIEELEEEALDLKSKV